MGEDALRPVSRQRLYEHLVERLRAHVAEARLRTGDRLPPERELAERLGVSRASIKQAILVLEVQGLVEVRHGGGTYLRRDDLAVEPVDALLDRKRRLPDVLEAREALEVKLAELAAERRSDNDIAAMDAALAEMGRAVTAGELGDEGDRRFHESVAAAAHNPILVSFMRQIAPQVAESRVESLRQPGRPARSLAQHERIAAAIRAGDPRRAAAAMRRHVATVSKVRLLTWAPDEDSG
jgi:GntR family transcriptional regulator, transcriptional repressor for pyruvate dehydrogenase complex